MFFLDLFFTFCLSKGFVSCRWVRRESLTFKVLIKLMTAFENKTNNLLLFLLTKTKLTKVMLILELREVQT